jgi:hypothetical protein
MSIPIAYIIPGLLKERVEGRLPWKQLISLPLNFHDHV